MKAKTSLDPIVDYTTITDDGKRVEIALCSRTLSTRYKNVIHYFLHFHSKNGGEILAMTSRVLVVAFGGKKITYIIE